MKLQPSKKEPHILILTGSIGSGHLSAARAIADAIEKRGAKAKMIDFMETFPNFATRATKSIYLNSLKLAPKIYSLLFSQAQHSDSSVKLLNTLSSPFMLKKIEKFIEEDQPALLVSTFSLWDILFSKVWKKHGKGQPLVSMITDSIQMNHAWTSGNPDYYIVPNEDTRVAIKSHGIPENRIKALGFPVAPEFLLPIEKTKDSILHELGLDPDRTTLLIIFSTGMQKARVKKIAYALKNTKVKNIQSIIVAGGDSSWRSMLEEIRWDFPTHITGWTNVMHELMKASDMVLGKAGGATLMECIHAKKPMIVIDAIPGQEIGNAMLVEKYNLGTILHSEVDNFDESVNYILSNKKLIEKNLTSQQKPNAALDIADFLIQIIK